MSPRGQATKRVWRDQIHLRANAAKLFLVAGSPWAYKEKGPDLAIRAFPYVWCPEEDLNLHGRKATNT